MRFPNAAKGIRKIYLAEILNIAMAVFGIGIQVLLAVNDIDTSASRSVIAEKLMAADQIAPFVIYTTCAVLMMLAAFCLTLSGIISAAKDDGSFKRALGVLIVGTSLSIVIQFLQDDHLQIANWLRIASTFCTMMVVLLVLEGICRLADILGEKKISALGGRSRKFLLCAFILSAASELLVALHPEEPGYATACGIAAYLLDIVAYMLYRRVLGKARLMQ